MIEGGKSLPPGSVKDRQISGQAKIKHGKLAQVADAQILVGGADKKLSAQTVSGDATLANDGTLTLDSANIEAKVKSVLTEMEIEEGAGKNMTAGEIKRIYEEIPGVNRFNNNYENDLKYAGDANTGSTLVKRDSDGNIAVGTVTGNLTGTATNADKLDSQDGAYYLNVANHTGQGSVYEYSTTSTSSNVSQSPSTFTHNLGYIPDVTVYQSDGETPPSFSEIDAEVKSTTTTTDVSLSEAGVALKVIIK